MSKESNTPEESNPVTLSAEQFSEMMTTIQELSKKVDVLQSELDTTRVEGGGRLDLIAEGDKQQAVMHTIRQANMSKEMFRQQKLEEASQSVDLAVEAAILDYKRNPPKHRA